MHWIRDMLERWHWVPSFLSRDEELNKEAANALQNQKRLVQDVRKASDVLHESSNRVRAALEEARLQAATFAQFEQRIKDPFKSRRLRN